MKIRELEVGLEVLEQVDDLRLDRHVERRDRLVADDEVGVERGDGEADALPLASRELVRIATGRVGGEPDDLEELPHATRALFPPGEAVHAQRLADDPPDAVARVERRVQVLKTICIRRRSGRSSFCDSVVMSLPSKTTLPAVGS